MRKNILKLERKYRNLVDLTGVRAVSSHANVVDLRERRGGRSVSPFRDRLGSVVAPRAPRALGERRRTPVSYGKVASKALAVLIIVSLNAMALGSIGSTWSVLNDVEASENNLFRSGILDFAMTVSPFNNDAWANLIVGTTTDQNIDVVPHVESNPFVYFASSTNLGGDETFCDAINVLVTLDDDTMYDGPLASLLSPTTTLIMPWNMEFSTNQPFFDSVCEFSIDWNGWQTRHDYPNYHDGYSDTERTDHVLYSDGLKINKVYFEKDKKEKKKKEDKPCLCDHPNHVNGDDHDCGGHGGHIDIHVHNENNGTTTNTITSTSTTGGNNTTGSSTIITGGATSTATTTNTINQNITTFGGGHHGDKDKVTICHATESDINPYVQIVVDEHALNGHFHNNGTPFAGHEEDLLLEGIQQCPNGTGHKKHDHEWVELYNPNNEPANIDGWFICDGQACDTLAVPEPIPPLGFAIIVSDEKVFELWNVPDDFVKIVMADGAIGDGLDNDDDALTLRRPDNHVFDAVNWGIPDPLWPYYLSTFWNPGVVPPPPGGMLARVPTGFDTNTPDDWHILFPPEINLLYPGHHIPLHHKWYWNYNYIITWEAENPNGDDEDLTIDIIMIRDSNHNFKVDDDDERIVLADNSPNDGIETITVPPGFLGFIWIHIIATGPENPMAHGFDRSGKIFDPIPQDMLDTEDPEEKEMMRMAALEQILEEGESEYEFLVAESQELKMNGTTTATTTATSTPDTNASTPASADESAPALAPASTTEPVVEEEVASSTFSSPSSPETIETEAGTTTELVVADESGSTTEPVLEEELSEEAIPSETTDQIDPVSDGTGNTSGEDEQEEEEELAKEEDAVLNEDEGVTEEDSNE